MWMIIGGVVGLALIAVILVVVFAGRGEQQPVVAAPVQSSSTAPPAAQPTVTVTAPQPAPTPPPVPTVAAAAGTELTGSWSGTMTSANSVYVAELKLSQAADGSLSGTMTNTSESSHNRGTYRVTGYRQGGRVVLNGTGWVSRPNNQWFMDRLDLSYVSAAKMSGTFGPVDDPSTYTGDVRLRRN